MKALHIIETLNQGGAEQALLNLLPQLRTAGVESSVATLWGDNKLAPALEEKGIPIFSLNCGNRRDLYRGARSVARLANSGDYDVMHSHLFFSGIYSALAGELFGCNIPKLTTFHNLAYAPGCNKPGLTLWIRKNLESHLLKRQMNASTAVSTAVAEHYQQVLGLPEITVIPNGVEVELVRRDPALNRVMVRQRYGLPQDNPLLAMPARLVHEKGHLWLLSALAELDRSTGFHLVIAGEGPMRDLIESSIHEHQLTNRVTMIGYKPQHELFQLVQSADLVVAPSIFEGFGLSVAEAMCMEVPIIATRSGGLPDLIGEDGGILIDCYDKAALNESIFELINDPTGAKQLGKQGRQRVVEHFSSSAMAGKLAELYSRTIG